MWPNTLWQEIFHIRSNWVDKSRESEGAFIVLCHTADLDVLVVALIASLYIVKRITRQYATPSAQTT